MITFDEACAKLADAARALGSEFVPLIEAQHRVLAAAVRADRTSPEADTSSMDGWAVREADLASLPARLSIVGESRPGAGFDGAVNPGQCARIFTGAPVPGGADRVIIQEVVTRDGDHAVFNRAPEGPRFIRPRGSDFHKGETLLDAGVTLTPQALIAAAAADVATLEVVRRPRVILLATGDELAEPGQARATPGAIPDSASFGAAALARDWGATVIDRLRLKDDLDSMIPVARRALDGADVAVVIGGASVGERDFAKAMFEPAGLELIFSKVAIKPGKPVWLGRAQGKLVLGLPGNPTSALVTARLFLAPLLAILSGRGAAEALAWRPIILAEPLPATGDREAFYRAVATPAGAAPLADQDSGAQKTLSQATVLLRGRIGAPGVPAGGSAIGLDL